MRDPGRSQIVYNLILDFYRNVCYNIDTTKEKEVTKMYSLIYVINDKMDIIHVSKDDVPATFFGLRGNNATKIIIRNNIGEVIYRWEKDT